MNLQATFDRCFPPPDWKEGRFLIGYVWRPMRDNERAMPGELLAMMPKRDRDTAMEMMGPGRAVTAIVRDGGLTLLKHSA